jgi:hypothetical protein
MSIHDFHSKLISGKEEGGLMEGLRRIRGIGKPVLAEGTEPGWVYWAEGTQSGTAEPAWIYWDAGSEAPSRA